MKTLFILAIFLVAYSSSDNVVVNWILTSCSASGFGFSWSAVDGGEPFKPDAKNGMMVPCDEWFEECFSFVDLQGNTVVFPGLQAGSFFSNIPTFVNINGQVITSTIQVENPGFGVGFVSFSGAYYAATGQPFVASCPNNQPNFKIQTYYLLTATNNNPGGPNYIRALNQVYDNGTLGFGTTVNPYPNPSAAFNIGQTVCNSAAGTDIRYSFPAYGTSVTGLPGVTPAVGAATGVVTTAAANPVATSKANTANLATSTSPPLSTVPQVPLPPANQATPQNNVAQTGNGLSAGGVAGIVICVLVVVAAAGIAAYVWYRKRQSIYYHTESTPNRFVSSTPNVVSPTPVFVNLAPVPVVNKPLPPSPTVLFVGMPVMARYSVDGKEYKAVIDEIRPGPQYLVRYIGFGNDAEWLPASDVRPM